MAKEEQHSIVDVNRQALETGMKQWAAFGERFTGMALDMAQRTTEIASDANKEAISNMREAMGVREEPAEYGRAMSELLQKQADLTTRTMKAYGDVATEVQSQAAEMASTAAEDSAQTASSAAKKTANKAQSAANKAA